MPYNSSESPYIIVYPCKQNTIKEAYHKCIKLPIYNLINHRRSLLMNESCLFFMPASE